MYLALIIILIILLLGGLPSAPWSVGHPWGYYPSGLALVLVVILCVLLLTGRL